MGIGIELAERGLLPEWVTRYGIRRLNRQRIRESVAEYERNPQAALERFLSSLRESPIALHTTDANEQHYELPPSFFEHALGPRRKYSCCSWEGDVETLAEAEEQSLRKICERAGIENGMDILELGCGWGSLTLWLAEQYPDARILAVSNSAPQREFILERCRALGFTNVGVATRDMNRFETDNRFDRVVSIEMFEHMRNLEVLLDRISCWLRPEGRLFVHVFCHRSVPYFFETEGDDNWMGRHFFTGGMMPSADLFQSLSSELEVEKSWHVNGVNYQKTADAWLENLESRKPEVMRILEDHYGNESTRWFHRWRVFFMACSELFGWRSGNEWFVAHSLLRRAR